MHVMHIVHTVVNILHIMHTVVNIVHIVVNIVHIMHTVVNIVHTVVNNVLLCHCLVAHRSSSSSQSRSLESPHMAAVREWQRNMAAISWQPYHHGGTKGIDLFPDNC